MSREKRIYHLMLLRGVVSKVMDYIISFGGDLSPFERDAYSARIKVGSYVVTASCRISNINSLRIEADSFKAVNSGLGHFHLDRTFRGS
jgi:hypothetical protein